jgi:hypothetical protein
VAAIAILVVKIQESAYRLLVRNPYPALPLGDVSPDRLVGGAIPSPTCSAIVAEGRLDQLASAAFAYTGRLGWTASWGCRRSGRSSRLCLDLDGACSLSRDWFKTPAWDNSR